MCVALTWRVGHLHGLGNRTNIPIRLTIRENAFSLEYAAYIGKY